MGLVVEKTRTEGEMDTFNGIVKPVVTSFMKSLFTSQILKLNLELFLIVTMEVNIQNALNVEL